MGKNNFKFLAVIFDAVSKTINGMERAFIDMLSALVPYAVPIIPAYLTYYHTMDAMNFPEWVAKTTAFVVEVLGIASVSTAIRFFRHNQKYVDKKRKAPFWLAVTTYVFYLAVVLIVNVMLEVDAGVRRPVVIWAIGLFTMLSVPSGVLISIRSQFTEALDEWESRKGGGQQQPAKAFDTPQVRTKHASDYHDKIIQMLEDEYAKRGRILAPKEISKRLGLDNSKAKGYISTQTGSWKRSKNIP